jgi:hypothetical protein
MRGLKFDGVDLQHLVETGPATEQYDHSTSASFNPHWTALEHSAGQACFERFVFTTSGGYLGIGSSTIEPGDKVVVLLGCKVPVVLRPLDQGGYKLIGDSYVDGMMYGEMMMKVVGQGMFSTSIEYLDIL